MPPALRLVALVALLTVPVAAPAGAQSAAPTGGRVDLVLRGVPADAALAALADAADLDIAYATELVGTSRVWCGGTGADAEAVLRCITDAVGLDFVRRSSGTYVVTARVVEDVPPGDVVGLVVDAATGAPLPLAHVRVAGVTAVADADGRFVVRAVAPGPHVLAATFVGFSPAVAEVRVAPGAVARPTLALRPRTVTTGTVVVDALQGRLASEALGADAGFEVLRDRLAGTERLGAAPLAEGAPAPTGAVDGAALRPLLGLAERTFRDGLSLQGGEPGEHVVQIDGATVYEPLAIGPTLGAMSPLAVGRVTVRKAGFGARHGSFLAGVLQAEHALAAPLGWSAAAEADAYAASARVQHHARGGTWRGEPVETDALVAVRRHLWDVAPPGALDAAVREWNDVDPVLAAALTGEAPRARFDTHRHGSDVQFSDVHAALRVRAGAARSLRASVYRGTAGVATELFAVGAPHAGDAGPDPGASLLVRDATRWTNLAAALRADALLSPRWRVGAGARLSRHVLRQGYDAVDGLAAGLDGTEGVAVAEARLAEALDARAAADNGNALTELTVGADAALTLARGHEIAAGLEATRVDSRFHLLSAGFGAASFRDLDAGVGPWRAAAFAESAHRLASRWTIEPSLRLTALTTSADVIAEPRLALRFDAMPGDRFAGLRLDGVAARLAAGVYRQFASRVELATLGPSALVPAVALWLPSDGSLAPPSALHLAGEVLWQPTTAWSARLEAYGKAMPRLYALDYAALTAPGAPLTRQSEFLLAQEGRAVGVGARVERQAPRWAASAGLAVARTERRSDDRFGGRWMPVPWAEPVRATLGLDVLAAGSRTGSGLLLRARTLAVWGRAWAYRRAYYDVLPAYGAAGVPLDAPDADRLPPLWTTDLGLAYTRAVGPSRVELAFDVTNVLARRDVLDWSLRPDGEGGLTPVTRRLPGRQPSLRLRVGL